MAKYRASSSISCMHILTQCNGSLNFPFDLPQSEERNRHKVGVNKGYLTSTTKPNCPTPQTTVQSRPKNTPHLANQWGQRKFQPIPSKRWPAKTCTAYRMGGWTEHTFNTERRWSHPYKPAPLSLRIPKVILLCSLLLTLSLEAKMVSGCICWGYLSKVEPDCCCTPLNNQWYK